MTKTRFDDIVALEIWHDGRRQWAEKMLSYDEYKAWQNKNEAAFIAADKKELVNYE